ncbi:hypothetical protein GQ42DRAFT_173058, partial [Ramicandelaber brevisporus]
LSFSLPFLHFIPSTSLRHHCILHSASIFHLSPKMRLFALILAFILVLVGISTATPIPRPPSPKSSSLGSARSRTKRPPRSSTTAAPYSKAGGPRKQRRAVNGGGVQKRAAPKQLKTAKVTNKAKQSMATKAKATKARATKARATKAGATKARATKARTAKKTASAPRTRPVVCRLGRHAKRAEDGCRPAPPSRRSSSSSVSSSASFVTAKSSTSLATSAKPNYGTIQKPADVRINIPPESSTPPASPTANGNNGQQGWGKTIKRIGYPAAVGGLGAVVGNEIVNAFGSDSRVGVYVGGAVGSMVNEENINDLAKYCSKALNKLKARCQSMARRSP